MNKNTRRQTVNNIYKSQIRFLCINKTLYKIVIV